MSSRRIGSPVEEFVNNGDQQVHSSVLRSAAGLTNMEQGQQKVALGILVGVAFFSGLAGFLCMFGYAHKSLSMMSRLTRDSFTSEDYITEEVFDRIDAKSLKEYLRWLSEKPHTTGQRRDDEIATWIRQSFQKFQMDFVTTDAYDVLLSYPRGHNKIELLDGSNNAIITTSAVESIGGNSGSGGGPYTRDEVVLGESLLQAYNAYSPSGIVDGAPIYVNYARKEDFELLKEWGILAIDKIVIARYGMISARDKVKLAMSYGVRGLILYTDPQDVAREGDGNSAVYPNSWWLPGGGIRRETLLFNDGDPETPGWPSMSNAYRIDEEQLLGSLPKIPVQPVGYKDAKDIMSRLGGREAPQPWTGMMSGLTYRVGGEFTAASNVVRMRLTVNNELKRVQVSNVIGIIKGSVEPDRYVVIGNHRDSWSYGAVDASSGTAVMMKIAGSLRETMRAYGWRPRRSLVFVSFAASEFGHVGSQEWIEQHLPKLKNRVVAYINADTCVTGPDVDVTASVSLKNTIIDAIKTIPDPYNEEDFDRSYFDFWKDKASGGYRQPEEPYIGDISGTSDQAPFTFTAGIPSLNIHFTDSQRNLSSMYPARHTGYDTLRMYEEFIDPELKILLSCSQVIVHVLRSLSDKALLPYNIEEYAWSLKRAYDHVKEIARQQVTTSTPGGMVTSSLDGILRQQNVTFDSIDISIREFTKRARNWTKSLNFTDSDNPIEIRMANDQMMQVERIFLSPSGLPANKLVKHVILDPSTSSRYGRPTFPGLVQLMETAYDMAGSSTTTVEEKNQWPGWEQMRRHVNEIYIIILQATSHLKPNFVI